MPTKDQGQTVRDLAGCPFCGCDPYVHTPDFNGDHYQIGCYADGCGGEEGEDGAVWVNGRTFEEARNRWHRRAEARAQVAAMPTKDQGQTETKRGNPEHPCGRDGCAGHFFYVDDEYESLADGGSYEIYECDTCGRTKYVPLPD